MSKKSREYWNDSKDFNEIGPFDLLSIYVNLKLSFRNTSTIM